MTPQRWDKKHHKTANYRYLTISRTLWSLSATCKGDRVHRTSDKQGMHPPTAVAFSQSVFRDVSIKLATTVYSSHIKDKEKAISLNFSCKQETSPTFALPSSSIRKGKMQVRGVVKAKSMWRQRAPQRLLQVSPQRVREMCYQLLQATENSSWRRVRN